MATIDTRTEEELETNGIVEGDEEDEKESEVI